MENGLKSAKADWPIFGRSIVTGFFARDFYSLLLLFFFP